MSLRSTLVWEPRGALIWHFARLSKVFLLTHYAIYNLLLLFMQGSCYAVVLVGHHLTRIVPHVAKTSV